MTEQRRTTVLYIDDDAAMVRLVQRVLGRRGYDIVGVATSEEGLAHLAQGAVDVIALDHFLPTGTGLDFLAQLQPLASAPPVVYVTGSAEAAVAVAALKAGAADYVPKAVDEEFLELLERAIIQAMEKAQLQRERDQAERDLRGARDRAELLLHEVNHRVANSLTLVASLVRMQANAVSDPSAKAALTEIQARIFAIGGVHKKLYTSGDPRSVEVSDYLSSLLEDLATTMREAGHESQLRLLADPATVSTDKAVSIGVVVTELVTNAVKYAYTDGKPGEIRVELRKLADNKIALAVEDDGVGFDGNSSPKGTGVGSRIVSALARGLGSDVRYVNARGCRASLEFEI